MTFSNSPRRRGFTLIEVLLVLVILVIIMGMAVGTYMNRLKKARDDAARSQVGLFQTPLETYYLDIGAYPTANQGLGALRAAPADASSANKWNGPYLNKDIPLDPWGNAYQYSYPGKHNPDTYDVWSLGPDGVDGTADDIGNWTSTR
jgi:general secretion pathway protein G